jgi:trimethylamine--corrinoid protein Co-methyltransferase
MNRAIINLDQAALDKIHSHSLEILRDVGIRFPSAKNLALFKKHGFKVDGSMVHFDEKDIQKALATVPPAFTLEARNPSRSIRIGESNYAMAPGYGPPFIIEPSGEKRSASQNTSISTVQSWFNPMTLRLRPPISTSCWQHLG